MGKIEELGIIQSKPIMVAFHLKDIMEQNSPVAPLETALYSIQLVHTIAGRQSLIKHPVIKSTLEGAGRRLGKPVNPKELSNQKFRISLTPLMLVWNMSSFLFSLLGGYAGFGTMEELSVVS